MHEAAGFLSVQGEIGIHYTEPKTVPSAQADGKAGTLVIRAMIFSTCRPSSPFQGYKAKTTYFRATQSYTKRYFL
jgi:hypothetical protein